MRKRTAPARAAERAVFLDTSGRRWRRFWLTTGVLVAMIGLLATAVTPEALAPVWVASLNTASSFPWQAIRAEHGPLPVIGEGVFTRIARVIRSDGMVSLGDPFSGTVYGLVSVEDAEDIGTHRFVEQHFGAPPDHVLMLTFDDGPSLPYTPALLDILSRNHVPATFFDIGTSALRNADVVRRMVREGHEVGIHTFSHIDLGKHGTARDREELIATDRVLRTTAGYGTRLFRLPYGDEDTTQAGLLLAQQLGYLHVGFDMDTHDWEAGDTPVPVPALDGRGHVVLLHDGGGNRTETLDLVQRLIDAATAAGYRFTTVGAMVPPGYAPVTGVAATRADVITWTGLWCALVLPGLLVGWLFWFGVCSLSVISLWYLALALLGYAARRRHPPCSQGYQPLVSIVLAAYNEERVIERTVAGLAAVRYPRLEVIAVDDGSTDGTGAALARCASTWPALRVITQPNQGKAAALNEGFRAAAGEIVVTIDADTVLDPDAVDRLVRHFADPWVAVVAGHVKVGNRANLLTAWQALEYLTGICVSRVAESRLHAIMIAPGACTAWRREAVLIAGGWSTDTLAEDCDLTLAIHGLGYRVRQDIEAVAWTEAPLGARSLVKQRVRWTFGNLQAYHKHRHMMFRPRHGWLGMVVMPYAIASIVVPLVFLPLAYVTAALSLAGGNWHSIALFTVFVVAVQFAMAASAVAMARERVTHLLVVPVYRFIYEPLRTYVLYASLFKAIKGRAVHWYKPERTGTVRAPEPAVISREPSGQAT